MSEKEQELAKAQAEKNASLESLVRATAAATKEAGKMVSWRRLACTAGCS